MKSGMKKIVHGLVAAAVVPCACLLVGCGNNNSGNGNGNGNQPTAVHQHTYATTWEHDANYHWRAASCEHYTETVNYAAHDYNGDVCKVCGYDRNGTKAPDNTSAAVKVTVKFYANEGQFADSNDYELTDTYVYGEKIKVPEVTRAGYTFGGWRVSDSDDIYNFNTNNRAVDDLTLWAVWRPIINEYQVTLVLNDGTNQTQTKTTVNGYLTANEPEREGYRFVGWYTANETLFDTEDRVTANITLTAHWEKLPETIQRLAAPTLGLESPGSDLLRWNQVKGATGYRLRIWQGSSNAGTLKIDQTFDAYRTYYQYYDGAAGQYHAEILAIGDGEKNVTSTAGSCNFTLKQLAKPVFEFDISTSRVSWKHVYADQYTVTVDSQNVSNNVDYEYREGFDTPFYYLDLSNYAVGNHTVSVTASRNNYTSSSNSTTIEKLRLCAPTWTSATLDEVSGKYTLVWQSVAQADEYRVWLGDALVAKVTSGTQYVLSADSDAWTAASMPVMVQAFNNSGFYAISPASVWSSELTRPFRCEFSATSMIDDGEKFALVTFDLQGGKVGDSSGKEITDYVTQQRVTVNQPLQMPNYIPVHKYYNNGSSYNFKAAFTGWYTDAACTNLYDFTQPVTHSMTLYAGYTTITLADSSTMNCHGISLAHNWTWEATIQQANATNDVGMTYFPIARAGTHELEIRATGSYCDNVLSYSVYKWTRNGTNELIRAKTNITKGSTVTIDVTAEPGEVIYVINHTTGNNNYMFASCRQNNLPSVKLGVADVAKNTSKTVTATTIEGCEFVGWYQGTTLVSTDATYTCTVTEDTHLVAKYRSV